MADTIERSGHGETPRSPFTVILTGGIASGKSTVSRLFERLGASVVDTDVIAREIVEPGKPALTAIAQTFGSDVMLPDGSLNRPAMRQRVFSDPAARKRLEEILHPVIRAEASRQVRKSKGPYCILVVPLFHAGSEYRDVDRVLVIDVAAETQIRRLLERDGIDRELAEAMIASQISREDRLALADDIIVNSSELEHIERLVEQLHARYLRFAALRKRQMYFG